ncbi:MAG: hypothetical protein ABH821_05610 [archaeon]
MKEKANILFLDLGFSIIVILIIVFVVLSFVSQNIGFQEDNYKNLLLEKQTVFILDSLIKNNYSENPLTGSAFYNNETKRVESNVLDLRLLERINESDFNGFSGFELKEVSFESIEGSKRVFLEKEIVKGNCYSLERLVIVKGLINEKGLLKVVNCS